MRVFLRLTALLGIALVAIPSIAQGQESGRIPGWVFTPSMGMGGAWDDNVLLVNPADRPPPDYASPISPSLTLDYTGRRTQLSSGYTGSWVFYRRLDDLNSFDQNLRVSAQHRATSRVTLYGQEQLTIAPSTDALLLSGVPFQRIGTRTNALRGGVEAALSARTSIRTGYTLTSVAFDEDNPIGRELQGGRAHEIAWSVMHQMSPRLTLGADYAFNRAIIGGGMDVEDPGEDRFNIQRGGITAQYRLSPRLDVSGSLGVAQLGAGRFHEGQTGPTWGIGVTRRDRVVVLSASYDRSYVPSFGFGGTSQNESLTGSAEVPFARRRAYVRNSFSWLENDLLGADQPRLRTIALASVLGYRATRWLSAEGYYVRSQQDTRRPGGQLSRNQIGFRLVAARPMRLR
jgi:hypothetical protein